ncbi:anthranilate synthase component I family protein [Rathayibacter soli]|uniref:anthranilate synthase component I family protein n=1 Tax=Rathayibacter soli TaxID=3144168 RepID=UPI0027E4BF15|nr:anthranilate synthase component I family protein [Glaciibacter superstes]
MEQSLLRERIDGWVAPADAFLALYASVDNTFWLDRGVSATDGVSYMGEAAAAARDGAEIRSIVTASVATHTVRLRAPDGSLARERHESVFDFLDREIGGAAVAADVGGDDASIALSIVPAWIGWLGYEAGADAAGAPVAASRTPDAALLFADRAIAFDHAHRSITLTAAPRPGAKHWIEATRRKLAARAGAPIGARTSNPSASTGSAPTEPTSPVNARWRHNAQEYLDLIAQAQAAITRGDAYQLCLTNELRIDAVVDPAEAYLALRQASPTRNGGYLRIAGVSVLSASPEQFLSIDRAGTIITRPIKGTRPRGANAAEDAMWAAELLGSEKERAENLMIVDLMRNDIGRVARLGSVAVRDLLTVESYAQVHQLVSTVQAQLADGATSVAAVRACFPAGSMTGAPKLSAMRILHSLEGGPRGVYAGCFGALSVDGRVALSMVIRSIVADASGLSIGAGGGITALSVPEEELAEVRLKAAVLARIVGAVGNFE